VIHALTFAAYTVVLDGKTVLSHTRAAVLAGHVLLPIRTLGNALGADIGYDGHARTVTVQRGSHTALVHLNCRECIVGGTAYVPLRDVALAFGMGVGYDAGARVVALTPYRKRRTICARSRSRARRFRPHRPRRSRSRRRTRSRSSRRPAPTSTTPTPRSPRASPAPSRSIRARCTLPSTDAT
jgi:hypothetical protein